jgi:Uma2 family endonuclease
MNDVVSVPLPGTQIDPRYPDSDSRFMGETDFHNVAMVFLKEGLEDHFADKPDGYVASNLIFYYKEGDRKSRRDPDGLVAKGVGKHRRRSFRVWEEKKLPCTLFEIASKRTWRVDLHEKRWLYASVGIKEYFVFDPEGCYLDPVLQGFKLVKGQSMPMKAEPDGSLVSKELGLRLVPEGEMLRLIDLKTGQPVLTRSERADQEKLRAEQEIRRAKQEKKRAQQEQQRADQEKQRAEQEHQRADQEKQRAEQLAAEVERLRALLELRRNAGD